MHQYVEYLHLEARSRRSSPPSFGQHSALDTKLSITAPHSIKKGGKSCAPHSISRQYCKSIVVRSSASTRTPESSTQAGCQCGCGIRTNTANEETHARVQCIHDRMATPQSPMSQSESVRMHDIELRYAGCPVGSGCAPRRLGGAHECWAASDWSYAHESELKLGSRLGGHDAQSFRCEAVIVLIQLRTPRSSPTA